MKEQLDSKLSSQYSNVYLIYGIFSIYSIFSNE